MAQIALIAPTTAKRISPVFVVNDWSSPAIVGCYFKEPCAGPTPTLHVLRETPGEPSEWESIDGPVGVIRVPGQYFVTKPETHAPVGVFVEITSWGRS